MREPVTKPTRFRITRPWFDGKQRYRRGDVVLLRPGLRPARDWEEVDEPVTEKAKKVPSKDMKAMSEAASPPRKRPKNMPGI